MASGSTPQSTPAPTAPPTQHKRPPSPDHKRRDSDSHGPAQYKRARASSPPGRDRDRWDGHGSGRKRYNSPSWDRDRDRDAPPPPQAPVRRAREHEEEKTVNIPSVISWFVGTLPGPSAFDGKWPYMRTMARTLTTMDRACVPYGRPDASVSWCRHSKCDRSESLSEPTSGPTASR